METNKMNREVINSRKNKTVFKSLFIAYYLAHQCCIKGKITRALNITNCDVGKMGERNKELNLHLAQ